MAISYPEDRRQPNRRASGGLAAALRIASLAAHLIAGAAFARPPDPVIQPGPTEPLRVETTAGAVPFTVEIADTESERQLGLMYRRSLAPDTGMLFLFGRDQYLSFWMKNTYVPLDMIFIRSSGEIAAIVEHTTPQSLAPVDPNVPASAVLELNAGAARAHGLAVGDRVVHRAFAAKAAR